MLLMLVLEFPGFSSEIGVEQFMLLPISCG